MKAYDEDAKYILFINKSITILGCSTVNSLTIGFLGHISQHTGVAINLLPPPSIKGKPQIRYFISSHFYLKTLLNSPFENSILVEAEN